MICIDAKRLDFATLNENLRSAEGEFEILNCLGQRFIAAGMSDKTITITGDRKSTRLNSSHDT